MALSAGLALGLTIGTLVVFTVLALLYSRGRVRNVEDYITARNSVRGGVLAATIIASSMGAWILFSPAEASAAFGGLSALIGYAIGSAVPLLGFAFLAPRIRKLMPEGHTLTEYALARYGPAMYAYTLVVCVGYMFVFLAAEMTGITGALALVAGMDVRLTAALVGAFVLVYTTYGGIKASIFTDSVQILLILPLLVACFVGAVVELGGTTAIHQRVVERAPELLDPGLVTGLQFGAFVIIAILGAEMLNQAWWQRIYVGRDDRTVRRAFLISAVAVIPMVLLAGFFGLAAQGLGIVDTGDAYNADISFFLVMQQAMPTWVLVAVVLLALLLMMSTMDTLLNAIASVVTADVPRLAPGVPRSRLTVVARGLTVLAAVGAVLVSWQDWSVLTLFLVADLLAAATFVPLLLGLYTGRLPGLGALFAGVGGLVAGLAWDPTLRGLVERVPAVGTALPTPSFLYGFLAALLVSTGLGLLAIALSRRRYDLGDLARRVRRLDAATPPGAARPDVVVEGGAE